VKKKVGQLFVVPARGTFMNERSAAFAELVRHVRENHVGGVIWFQSNVYETARLNARLQSLAEGNLLVSADLEAGLGMRFPDVTFWPPAMAVAAAGDASLAEQQGRITAREARAVGIGQIYAPVVDVNVNPANPVINTRSYGETPDEVSRFATALIRGIEREGALATAKHFPGHGDTHVDSHRALPRLDVTRERLESIELPPFRAAIAAGVSSIMVGHLGVPAIDDTPAPWRDTFENAWGTTSAEVPRDAVLPATVSRRVVDGLLRKELGFDGLVVSDAFDMGGLAAHFDPGEAAVRAIEAGLDQIVYSPDPDAAIAAVVEALRSGRLTSARVDESLARIEAARRRIVDAGPLPFDTIATTVDAPEHREVAVEIARRSLVLLRDGQGLLPLRGQRVSVSVVVVSDLPEENPLREAVRLLAPQQSAFFDSRTPAGEADEIAGDLVVMLLALRPKSGAGRIRVPEAARRLAERRGAQMVAVSFGSPYIFGALDEVSTAICAWGIQPVLQEAAVAAMRGEIPFRGRLPVTLV
jgi:beta-N-acetylhexosaminidase